MRWIDNLQASQTGTGVKLYALRPVSIKKVYSELKGIRVFLVTMLLLCAITAVHWAHTLFRNKQFVHGQAPLAMGAYASTEKDKNCAGVYICQSAPVEYALHFTQQVKNSEPFSNIGF